MHKADHHTTLRESEEPCSSSALISPNVRWPWPCCAPMAPGDRKVSPTPRTATATCSRGWGARARGLAARVPGGDKPTALRWPRPSMTPATASASSIRPRSKRSAGVACRGPKPIPPMRGSSPSSVAPRSRPRGPRCPGSCASCKRWSAGSTPSRACASRSGIASRPTPAVRSSAPRSSI